MELVLKDECRARVVKEWLRAWRVAGWGPAAGVVGRCYRGVRN